MHKARKTGALKAPNDFSSLMDSFKELIGNQKLVLQILESLPVPIEIFTADGTAIFINRAARELFNVQDVSLGLGKYNIYHDPACFEIFGQELMDKALRGEPFTFPDYPLPVQDMADREVMGKKQFEVATANFSYLPVWDGDVFLYAVCLFVPKNAYPGNPKIAKAKKYIDEHWLDGYDVDAVANAVGVSASYLQLLFRKHAGSTLYGYYKSVKVDHIKEKLADISLSIAEVFHFCGTDSRGTFARTFKKLAGMTPKEYRNSMKK